MSAGVQTGTGNAMAQNGDVNMQYGLYRNLCCGLEIIVREGAKFPDCENHPKLSTVWKLVEFAKNNATPASKSQHSA